MVNNVNVRAGQATGGGVALPPSAEKIQAKYDLAIALILYSWTSLTIAVQNSWGGPDAAEKRDWFAGQISDLMKEHVDADVEYVEEFLIGVMNDNFDVHIDDGSAEEIAAKIVGIRKMIVRGDFKLVDELYAKWQERTAKGGDAKIKVQHAEAGEDEQDTDWDSGEEDEEDEDGDIEMGESSTPSKPVKEKIMPKIDEDGFTEVVSKKRR